MDLRDGVVEQFVDPEWEAHLDEWDAAYTTVESYFGALRIRHKLLLSRLVYRVLRRAAARTRSDAREPSVLAMEEAMRLVAEWLERVLQEERLPEDLLATRGRLALFLADMPGRWAPLFLKEPPWAVEFEERMRRSYLNAGPRFQTRTMAPRPFEISPLLTGMTGTWESLGRTPFVQALIVVVLLVGIVAGFVIFLW